MPETTTKNPTDVGVIVRAILGAMRITLRNLLRKPVTVHYPDKQRSYPERYRGLLALVYEKDTGEEACIGCRLCEYVCPPAVIKVEMLNIEKRNYARRSRSSSTPASSASCASRCVRPTRSS